VIIHLGPFIHLWSVKGIVILAFIITIALGIGYILGKSKLDEQSKILTDEQSRKCKTELDEQRKTITDEQSRSCKSELDEQSRICKSELNEQSKRCKSELDEQSRSCKSEQDEQSRSCKSELDEQSRRCKSELNNTQEVISAQVKLIMNWKKAKKDFIRVMNEYIEDVVKYCELKEKIGWVSSLSDMEKCTMKRLQDKITFPQKK